MLRLDGQPFTVIGVLPAGFALEAPIDIFVPAAYTADDPENRLSLGGHSIVVFGRLRPGASLDGARQEMSVIAERLTLQYPDLGTGWRVTLASMLDARVGDTRPVLYALLGAVGFLLMIACANVANLLLARAAGRSAEMALRAALGASRGRILRQLLAEGAVLAVGGGLLGVVGSWWGCRALANLAPDGLPRVAEIALDGRALGLALALVVVTAFGSGLAPALLAARLGLNDAMKLDARDGGRASGGAGGGQRLRGALVVAQVATAIVLLAGAGLLVRSFANLQAVPRGFNPQGALTFSLSLPRNRYPSDPAIAAFAERAARRLRAIPGVRSAGASQALPFAIDLNIVYFAVAGRPAERDHPTTYVFEVTPGYLAAMGIPVLQGRGFEAPDVAGAPRVVIINQAIARRYFPGEDPIGQRIGRPDTPIEEWGQIVGVVADVKDGVVSSLDHDGCPLQIYVPFAQNPYDALTFVVRAGGGAETSIQGLASTLRDALRDVDAELPLADLRPLRELVAESIARQRFAMFVLALLSSAALLLAAVGIFGVTAYAVAEQTGEIGIRMALGARSGEIVGLVLEQTGRLIALGIGVGLLGAWTLTRLLAPLVFGVSTSDPATLAVIVALLTLVAAIACLIPARRAARVAPMAALRAD